MRKIAILLSCFLGMTTLYAETAAPAAQGFYTADKTNIIVSPKENTFTLKLKSNPSTGYLWFLRDYDLNLITPIKHVYEKPNSKMMGAPGMDIWTFEVKPSAFNFPRQTVLRMVYARPFSSENMTPVLFTISTLPV